jgi:type IV pilus assembly protein PilN
MATTALIPVDPAASARQLYRILPIRANLLPDEITAGRRARRTRLVLIGAIVLVMAMLAIWYRYSVVQKNNASDELTAANQQTQIAHKRQRSYQTVTDTINYRDALTGQLKSLLADDLPWPTLLDSLRSTAVETTTELTSINAALVENTGAPSAGTAPTTTVAGATETAVATLAISGEAADKKTIAKFIDAVGALDGVRNAYLTTATQGTRNWTFTLTAEITSSALCGRFTTPCTTGGN